MPDTRALFEGFMPGDGGSGGAAWAALAVALAGVTLAGVVWNRHERLKRRHRELMRRFVRVETDALRARRVLYAREAERAMQASGRAPGMPIEFTAEWGEDLFLWDLFAGQETGTYLEVGAYDGHTLSVTYPFEAAGWTGVLIEGLPDRFALCRSRRAGSVVVHAAVSKRGSSGMTEFHRVPGEDQSQMLSYLATNAPHEKLVTKRERAVETVRVPLTTMDAILDGEARQRGIGRLDFCVIDVEGGELELLDGFDLERHKPRVLVIEDLYKGKNAQVRGVLEGRGYVMVARVGRNQVFIRADEGGLIARVRDLAAVLE